MLYEVKTILFPLIIADVKEFREESVQLLTVGKQQQQHQNSVLILFFILLYGVHDFLRNPAPQRCCTSQYQAWRVAHVAQSMEEPASGSSLARSTSSGSLSSAASFLSNAVQCRLMNAGLEP